MFSETCDRDRCRLYVLNALWSKSARVRTEYFSQLLVNKSIAMNQYVCKVLFSSRTPAANHIRWFCKSTNRFDHMVNSLPIFMTRLKLLSIHKREYKKKWNETNGTYHHVCATALMRAHFVFFSAVQNWLRIINSNNININEYIWQETIGDCTDWWNSFFFFFQ